MAIHYVDPEGGNDANDGSSFAQRKRTLPAVSFASGDEIRLMASKPPAVLGSATWTASSRVVTLATAPTKLICTGNDAWTGVSANVSQGSHSSSSSYPSKNAAAGTRYLNIATNFTTGKVAYLTLPGTLDLSAYEQFCAWVYLSSAAAASDLELSLCSDAAGDTPVHTARVKCSGSGWTLVRFDNGAALSATVNSVLIGAAVDPGSTTVILANLIACKASNQADTLTLDSLVRRDGEDVWYTVQTIEDNVVRLGGNTFNSNRDAFQVVYDGASGTADMIVWNPTDIQNDGMSATSVSEWLLSVTNRDEVTITGGWDRTDMSTQDGETLLSAGHRVSGGVVNITGTCRYKFQKVSFANGGYCVAVTTSSNNGGKVHVDDATVLAGGAYGVFVGTSQFGEAFVNVGQIACCYRGLGLRDQVGRVELRANKIHTGEYAAVIDVFSPVYLGPVLVDVDEVFRFDYGLDLNGPTPFVRDEAGITIKNATFRNNNRDVSVPEYRNQITLMNCELLSGTPYFLSGATLLTPRVQIRSVRHNKQAGAALLSPRADTFTDTSIRQTASGFSWRVDTKSVHNIVWRPWTLPLATLACKQGISVTVKCYVRRNNTDVFGGIRINPDRAIGVTEESVEMTAAADTWEEVSISFTPTFDTAVEIEGFVYGAVSRSFWFDSLTVE